MIHDWTHVVRCNMVNNEWVDISLLEYFALNISIRQHSYHRLEVTSIDQNNVIHFASLHLCDNKTVGWQRQLVICAEYKHVAGDLSPVVTEVYVQ